MLEKLAEMVREQDIIEGSFYNEEEKRVYVYTTIPVESPVTINADVSNPVSAEYKLARWAVLLVAKWLEKELTGVENAWDDFYEAHDKGDDEGLKKAEAHYLAACRECATELLHLVVVAEPANVSSVEEQMRQKEDTNDTV